MNLTLIKYTHYMVLLVLRHGQSIWNRINILAGWKDVPLSLIGKREAYEAAKILDRYNFNNIYTSNLTRAVETTHIVYDYLYNHNPDNKITIEITPDLKERNYGDLAGKKKEDLINQFGTDDFKYWRRSYFGRPPNGENLHDVKLRVGNYFDKSIHQKLKENKNVLIIAHSNSLRALFVHLGLKDEKTIEDFEINNCIPIEIDLNNRKFYYETNNFWHDNNGL